MIESRKRLKHYKYIKLIVVIFTLLFQPVLMAETIKISNSSFTSKSIQVGKVKIGLKILEALRDFVGATTTTIKELNATDEKGTNWLKIVFGIFVALGSFYAIFFDSNEE